MEKVLNSFPVGDTLKCSWMFEPVVSYTMYVLSIKYFLLFASELLEHLEETSPWYKKQSQIVDHTLFSYPSQKGRI